MIHLGTFTHTTNGFFGQITTFLMADDLSIVPNENRTSENAPDYRVLRGLEDDAAQVAAPGYGRMSASACGWPC
ncbi:DUF736 family protein [Acetobacter papayae]|uniref:DUF736 family protein n=1 Tax=Acetobacter papayae TaxID=1076592 RepID=UPI0006854168|nr:DUF736 family protein [Acetobacter papayae]